MFLSWNTIDFTPALWSLLPTPFLKLASFPLYFLFPVFCFSPFWPLPVCLLPSLCLFFASLCYSKKWLPRTWPFQPQGLFMLELIGILQERSLEETYLYFNPGSMTLDILRSPGLAFLPSRNDLIQGRCGGLSEIMCVKHLSLQNQSMTAASPPPSFAS